MLSSMRGVLGRLVKSQSLRATVRVVLYSTRDLDQDGRMQ